MSTSGSEIGSNVVQSPRHYLSRGKAMPEWPSLSIKEASAKSGYNEEYLRRLIRNGNIEAVKVGPAYLIKAESLEKYLEDIGASDDARYGPRRQGSQ